jgi:single-stranded DNA-binding protein
MEVLAVGDWADDTYTDEQGQRRVQIVMEARALGPTLRWATAEVNRTERRPDNNTIDMFAADSPREPTPQSTGPAAAPAAAPLSAGLSIIRGLPTPAPDADAPGNTRRRKKAEPEAAVSKAS